MDFNQFYVALGTFCGAMIPIGLVARWILHTELSKFSKVFEDKFQSNELARVARDAHLDNRMDNFVEKLADLERRKAQTKSDHEQKIDTVNRRVDKQDNRLDRVNDGRVENEKQIAVLTEAVKGLDAGQTRIVEMIQSLSDKLDH